MFTYEYTGHDYLIRLNLTHIPMFLKGFRLLQINTIRRKTKTRKPLYEAIWVSKN